MTLPAPAPVLVLAVGNPLRSDDGVGARVLERLAAAGLPAGVEVTDGATAGLDLALLLADRRLVVVVDAVAGEWSPGTVVRLDGSALAAGGIGGSSHEAGVADALEVVRRLGRGPERVVLVGVAAASLDPGDRLTPAVAAAVDDAAAEVLGELAREQTA